MSAMANMTGSCECGNVHYQVTGDPVVTVACHCNDCRKLSGSAFGTVIVINADDLALTGDLKMWEKPADSGRRKQLFFCPRCGNRIYHQDPDAPELVRIRSGTLDLAELPEPQVHVYAARKQSWVNFAEGVTKFAGQPPGDKLHEAIAEAASPD